MQEPFDFDYICEKLLGKCSDEVGPHGCHLWQGAKWKNNQYGKVLNPLPNKQTNYIGAHRLLFMMKNQLLMLPREDEQGRQMDVSHICHQGLCLTVEHLVHEPHQINIERKQCKMAGQCSLNHEPNCLF